MRKITMYIACSLDGYIADSDEGIDWLFTDQDYGYSDFLDSIDTLIMGRKSWNIIESFGEWPYGDRKVFVFTRNKKMKTDNQNVQFMTSSSTETVEALKNIEGKDIWLVGGGLIVTEFLSKGLIDEFAVFVHPILLGEGIHLFPKGFDRTYLKLEGTKQYSSGLVELRYIRQ
ncbi:MAG TPA: dihydrofolate reductase family protein [bacterium]|jgi:dihydrofolate reductase